jgi:putative transposase
MLTQQEFDNWCLQLKLSDIQKGVIERIRTSPPSRVVGGGRRNVSGRYPSRKMGVTIQFESHRVELPKVYELEHDEDVLEFYDQPAPIKLEYQGKNGRNLAHMHTPDFFVIRRSTVGWEECKTEADLEKLAEKSPNRYSRGETGHWSDRPGTEYAKQYGFYYRMWSDAEIDWVLARNTIFLEDYFRRIESLVIKEELAIELLDIVAEEPGILLTDLLERVSAPQGGRINKASSDDIYTLITTERLYVNLSSIPLAEPGRVRVFINKGIADSYILLNDTRSPTPTIISPVIHLVSGESVCWDGKGLDIVHVGDRDIVLRGDDEHIFEIKKTEFEKLVRQGKIVNLARNEELDISQEAWARFQQASPQDREEALRRYKVIAPYLQGQPPEIETVSERTIRDWRAKYSKALQQYNCGYVGLLSHSHIKGNRSRKLPEDTLAEITKFITEEYETNKQKNVRAVYGSLANACEQKGIIAPSYKTFVKEVNRRSGHEQTEKRQGRRAAYQQQEFYWELDRTTPRHGDRPFEIGHIDHTELDIELVCSQTRRNLGRPWATFLVDAYSRRLLAVYLTFDSPSYRSCLMVLRICVKNHGRLPQIVVVDNGAEFRSTYFETLLATFAKTQKQRPPAKARFGSVCERLFGTSNTEFVHNLSGNTQITRNVRQVTKSVNPKNHAIWTLGTLYEYLCTWAYEVYDTDDHPALGQTPREAFAAGMLQGGSRIHQMIAYDENFKMLTLPTTSKGVSKVQSGSGVKINSIYYWSSDFKHPEIKNTDVPVRYDPFDAGTAHAFVRGHWVKCISEYHADFRSRSEKEMKLASAELRKRNQNHQSQSPISAKKLATFLTSAEGQEALLEQRSRDIEGREVFKVIEGGQAKDNIAEVLNLPEIAAAKAVRKEKLQSLPTGKFAFTDDNLETYEEF